MTHDLSGSGMEFRNYTFEEIVVEDSAFVGAGAGALPGVTIKENAVVGANATVAEDIPAGTVRRDAPAQSDRQLGD